MIDLFIGYFNASFVFCYHRVIPEEIAKEELCHRALYVTPETFENHVKWMKKNGAIIGLDEFMADTRQRRFMVTFDDGWKDNLTYALPILKKYNATATIFITTRNIDHGELFWPEELGIQISTSLRVCTRDYVLSSLTTQIRRVINKYKLEEIISFNNNSTDLYYLLDRMIECLKMIPDSSRDNIISSLYVKLNISPKYEGSELLLNWDDISFLSDEGISFGSHTHTHALLDRIDNKTIDTELSRSKKILEQKIGKEINAFSYPNGYFQNQYIQKSLSQNGYKFAFTLERSPLNFDNPFLIPRCLVYEDIAFSMDRYYMKLLMRSIFSGFAN